MYAGCPVIWCSKLQTEIALSTTEAEYISLSQATRDVLPFMDFLKEIAPRTKHIATTLDNTLIMGISSYYQ